MDYRIAIVDDHQLLRDGLRLLLAREGFSIPCEAGSLGEAMEKLRQIPVDLVILDIHLPDGNGIDALDTIQSIIGETKILVLTAARDASTVNHAILSGVAGYLLKEDSITELAAAVRAIRDNKSYLCPHAATIVSQTVRGEHLHGDGDAALSARETQVLDLLVKGLRNKEIADKLGVSTKSVDTYRSRIMEKTGCTNMAALVQYAIKTGRMGEG